MAVWLSACTVLAAGRLSRLNPDAVRRGRLLRARRAARTRSLYVMSSVLPRATSSSSEVDGGQVAEAEREGGVVAVARERSGGLPWRLLDLVDPDHASDTGGAVQHPGTIGRWPCAPATAGLGLCFLVNEEVALAALVEMAFDLEPELAGIQLALEVELVDGAVQVDEAVGDGSGAGVLEHKQGGQLGDRADKVVEGIALGPTVTVWPAGRVVGRHAQPRQHGAGQP
jgi:hypothetical protein